MHVGNADANVSETMAPLALLDEGDGEVGRRERPRERSRERPRRGRGAPPREDLDLPGRVHENMIDLFRPPLAQVHDLVEPRREQVRRGQDRAVRPEVILFHHRLVVHRVADVHVGVVREVSHRGV
eukprot:24615-Pelagococcus_subviridis.AAC.4